MYDLFGELNECQVDMAGGQGYHTPLEQLMAIVNGYTNYINT